MHSNRISGLRRALAIPSLSATRVHPPACSQFIEGCHNSQREQQNHQHRGHQVSNSRFLSTIDNFDKSKDADKTNFDAHDDHDDDDFDDVAYQNFDDATDDDEQWGNEVPTRGSKKKTQNEDSMNGKRRIYLDPKAPLEDRVNLFLNKQLGQLHPLDIVLTSESLIRECGKRKTFEGMKYAHDILDRLIEEKHFVNQQNAENGEDASVAASSYTIVIPERIFEVLMYGWSNLARKVTFAPQRMREVLDLMIQEATYDHTLKVQQQKEGTLPTVERVIGKKHSDVTPQAMFANMSCQPTVGVYNTLLQGLCQASHRSIQAAIEAENVLKTMERIAAKRGWHVKPNTKSFMLVIQAFSKTGHATAGDRAEAILRYMIKYHDQQVALYQEETGTEYDLLNESNNSRRIVTPDTIAYTGVIQAHGESGSDQSAEKALELLTELLQSSNPKLAHDPFVFAATINVFAKRAANHATPEGRLEAARCAEEVLWLMLETIQSQSLLQSDDKKSNPYVVPFNACLKAWAQSDAPGSALHAEELLSKILDPTIVGNHPPIQPDVVSINTCMQAWARASKDNPEAPEKAEGLLRLFDEMGSSVQADVASYTTVMSAYAKSNRPDKAAQALRLLESLLSNLNTTQNRTLSAIPFTVVLNAVAHSSTKKSSNNEQITNDDAFGSSGNDIGDDNAVGNEMNDDPYDIALRTYDLLSNDLYGLNVQPDHLTFATMLNVIEKYTRPDSIERRQRLERVLEDACSAGEVSSKVVEALAKACPSQELLESMLQVRSWPIESVNALPRAWTYKVEPNFRKLRLSGSGGGNKRSGKPKRGGKTHNGGKHKGDRRGAPSNQGDRARAVKPQH